MFFRKKKLYEVDPKTLSMEHLYVLHGSLIAKLLLVTRELQRRSEGLIKVTADTPGTEEPREIIGRDLVRLRATALLLENLLADAVGGSGKISN
jgi:hypothetical protein